MDWTYLYYTRNFFFLVPIFFWWLLFGWLLLGWLLLRRLLLRWLLLRWLLLGWLLLRWLLLGWLILRWLLLRWLHLRWLPLRWLLLTFSLCKTPLGETGCLGNLYFTHWLPKHPVFWFTLTQSVRLPVVTYHLLCSTCANCGTLCHAIGHQVFPTQPLPREGRNSQGVRSIISMSLRSHT